ncbi:MAG: cell division protein CrgA [Acidimicrobiales bacterium]
MADDVNDTADDDAPGPDDELVEAPEAGLGDEADAAADVEDEDGGEELPPPSEAKKKADAVIAERRAKDPSVAERKVERRVVTSRRVTPKAGAKPAKDAAPAAESKARDAKKTEQVVARSATLPTAQAEKYRGPSPWWVPVIMFGLIIVGALVIMLNYMGAFGDPENVRLVIGLVLILGGIITATQYR